MPTPEVTGSAALHSKEIKKIAREYAESANPNKPYDTLSDGEKKLRDFGVEQVYIPLLEWLSKDFCIVPKSKLHDEYADAVSEGKHAHVKHQIQSRVRLRQLEALFGKSLFEEEK